MPRVAVAQMACTASPEQNVRNAADLIAQARLCGARLLCLPDGVDYVVSDPGQALSLATPLHANGVLSRLAALAAQADVWVSAGGVHELSPDGTRLHKTHVLLSPHSTQPVATYRRLHAEVGGGGVLGANGALFGGNGFGDGGGGVSGGVDAALAPGDKLTVAMGTPVGNVGLLSGHDARFGATADALAAAGAEVLAVATQVPGGLREAMLRTRAADTQCYVVAAARVRADAGKAEGSALVVAPDGSVVADGGAYGAGVVWADVESETVQRVRAACPLLKQRREDVVGRVVAATRSAGVGAGGFF